MNKISWSPPCLILNFSSPCYDWFFSRIYPSSWEFPTPGIRNEPVAPNHQRAARFVHHSHVHRFSRHADYVMLKSANSWDLNIRQC
jgi:hypothetical protein